MKYSTVIFTVIASVLIYVNAESPHVQPNISKSNDALVNINGSTYFISTTSDPIYQANEATRFCNSMAMRLLSLQTVEKAQMIYTYLSENGYTFQSFWTSGIRYQGSDFLWSNLGDMFSFTNWLPGEPNENPSTVDVCVSLYYDHFSPAWYWLDNPCDTSYFVICE